MVTVNPDRPVQPISAPKRADGPSTSQKSGFDAVLKQVVDMKASESARPEKTPFVADVHPARFAAEKPSTANVVVNKVQGLIDTMADYQQRLIENGVTLKDLHGIVGQMTSQSEALDAASKTMGADGNLEIIVNQALKLSSMEIARYYNGRYIDDVN